MERKLHYSKEMQYFNQLDNNNPKFDLIFIDADKETQIEYYETILKKKLLSQRGFMVITIIIIMLTTKNTNDDDRLLTTVCGVC